MIRFRVIPLFLFLLLSNPAARADMTSDGIALYKSRRYSMAASVLEEAASIDPENEEARYYLALSRAQMGKGEETVEALRTLLELDPCYYRYKIGFDRDFDLVRSSPPFSALAEEEGPFPLAVEACREPCRTSSSKDQICQTQKGLFLYDRGLKILLAPPSNLPYQAGFINDDSLYFVIDDSDDPKKPHSRTFLFSRENRESRPLPEGTAPFSPRSPDAD